MQQCSILFCIASLIIAVTGNAEDLRVNIAPVRTRVAATQDVNVVLKYTNTGNDTMYIYKWYMPQNKLTDKLFDITLDGKPVKYVGPLVKRRAPIPEDLVSLAPGQSLSTVVPLSTAYNMTQTGNYVVQYNMSAHHVLHTEERESALKRLFKSANDDTNVMLQSEPVALFAAGHRNRLIEHAKQYRNQLQSRAFYYTGCSSSQVQVIRNAMTAARSFADNAYKHLDDLIYLSYVTSRYSTWFGAYTESRHTTVRNHFAEIKYVLNNQYITFDCTCPDAGDSTYAYVYGSEHYNIYL